jgi:hypothetical protein
MMGGMGDVEQFNGLMKSSVRSAWNAPNFWTPQNYAQSKNAISDIGDGLQWELSRNMGCDHIPPRPPLSAPRPMTIHHALHRTIAR